MRNPLRDPLEFPRVLSEIYCKNLPRKSLGSSSTKPYRSRYFLQEMPRKFIRAFFREISPKIFWGNFYKSFDDYSPNDFYLSRDSSSIFLELSKSFETPLKPPETVFPENSVQAVPTHYLIGDSSE